jgi:hypothetical protein
VWWQRWQKRATSRTSVPHFGHFTVFCGAGVADAVPGATGDAADVFGRAVTRGTGADLSALLGAAPVGALVAGLTALVGALVTGLSEPPGAAAPGWRPIGLSEVVPLMLKFYRDAAPHAPPRRTRAPH